MAKSKDHPKYTEVKFTDAERTAFRLLHSCGLHESIEFSEQCELANIYVVNSSVVRMVMHPDQRDVLSEDELRAKALMVANTRIIEDAVGVSASTINLPNGGVDLLDSIVNAMSKLTSMNITHNFREYQSLSIHASSKGLDYKQRYRVDPRLLVSDPIDLMATLSVKIKEDFNEYLRRTKE